MTMKSQKAILRQFWDFPFDEHDVEDHGEHDEKKQIMKILMKLKNEKGEKKKIVNLMMSKVEEVGDVSTLT